MGSNYETIFYKNDVKFAEINGIRLNASIWVLGFHAHYFMFYKMSSIYFALIFAEHIAAQTVSNATFCVDAFFLIRSVYEY